MMFFMYLFETLCSDPTHVIDMSSLHVSDEGALTTEPVRILDQRVRQLRRRMVDQVKVQWDSYIVRTRRPGRMHMICANSSISVYRLMIL
jgi:hypothetical protein